MNHDYAHCLDYTKDCPKDCLRAELQRDIEENRSEFIGVPLTYSHLCGTEECELAREKKTNDTVSRQAAINLLLAEGMITAAIYIERMPSAQRWIPFTKRELTAEEQEEHPEWSYIMDCPLPDDGQEILVSNGRWVWKDEFCVDDGCYLDSDHELEGCAWMPLPEPWKGE